MPPAFFSLALDRALRTAAKESQTHLAAYIDDVQNINTVEKLNEFVSKLYPQLQKVGLELAPPEKQLILQQDL